jgi:hypothetical protein
MGGRMNDFEEFKNTNFSEIVDSCFRMGFPWERMAETTEKIKETARESGKIFGKLEEAGCDLCDRE